MKGDPLKMIESLVMPLVVACGLFLGYDYYSFTTDEDSALTMKQRDIDSAKDQNEKLRIKVKQGQEFLKSLDTKKVELRGLATELDSMKATLSESLDIPEFMKTVVTEARRVGLTVVSLKPGAPKAHEYYAEQPFELAFTGVYVQFLVFLERMSNIQRIVRVDNFNVKPLKSSSARYVELTGTVQLRTYRYLASKADELGRKDGVTDAKGAAPAKPVATPAQVDAKGSG